MEVIVSTDNVLSGIYFQDRNIREMYASFPEMLFVDATHKLNELRITLYIVLTEDGNGESEIVAVWLVVNEDESSIKQMVTLFKKYNENWKKTLVIMTDKDFVKRRVFQNEFLMRNC